MRFLTFRGTTKPGLLNPSVTAFRAAIPSNVVNFVSTTFAREEYGGKAVLSLGMNGDENQSLVDPKVGVHVLQEFLAEGALLIGDGEGMAAISVRDLVQVVVADRKVIIAYRDGSTLTWEASEDDETTVDGEYGCSSTDPDQVFGSILAWAEKALGA